MFCQERNRGRLKNIPLSVANEIFTPTFCPNYLKRICRVTLFSASRKVEVDRAAGLNDVGMVAWMLTLRTPEYPEGRQLVLIANDITHQVGGRGGQRPTKDDVWIKEKNGVERRLMRCKNQNDLNLCQVEGMPTVRMMWR